VWKVLISDDGSLVTTAGQDAQIHLWYPEEVADIDSLNSVACNTAGRSLTPDEWSDYMTGDYRQTCAGNFPEVVVEAAEAPLSTPTTPTPTPAVEASPQAPVPTPQAQQGSVSTPQPKPTSSSPLAVSYIVESAGANPANSSQWIADVLITASGGDGRYRYFHDGLPLTGPRVTVVYAACRNKPGSFWVEDGTGARATLDYFMYAPYCNKSQ
jgi:hypothetical protein